MAKANSKGMLPNGKGNGSGPIAAIPKRVIEHKDFIGLSHKAVRVLLWLAYQYTKTNNGKLCAVHSQLSEQGFASKSTLSSALKELRDKEFIYLTKGSRESKNGRTPNYYALSWAPIDEIKGFEMDVSPTTTPGRTFKDSIDNLQKRG